MTWLLPDFIAPQGRVRTVGNVSEREREAAKKLRWALSAAGRAWLERNRERRNAYHLWRYHSDPERREYLRLKQREYRAKS